ncbi:ubiquitin carboxyl-terminal hydrolase MINDY-3-like isoform X2 [Myxocyprinus asiaticus]|uniref:ubiquitin carboxyl-terminal hydrolase MINDY-3-like isoform X2 n=1 Tax=Myxocyprinus asiaticus TaxID=70543 RepID=UPI002222C839|nr:ubiquitin carboxyl-terminal hydrolase MINDY-3-like isoform X2 [Myxocyprinus asiaticus]
MSDTSKEVVHLVWGRPSGGGVSASLFRRWSQGFVFSESERSALEQFEGGPCAVIAPVQAFLLKNILFNTEGSNWKDISGEVNCVIFFSSHQQLLALRKSNRRSCAPLSVKSWSQPASIRHRPFTWPPGLVPRPQTALTSQTATQSLSPVSLLTHQLLWLLRSLALRGFTVLYRKGLSGLAELREAVLSLYDTWRNKFGVLLFLYSVIHTKGIQNIENEIEDTSEPLIDPVYGHGSQSLINLLVTGDAVSNVWDGDRECSGMKLHGIHQQASVGFLTLMESLHYCKVGAFLKSPKFPIWILGSETHLSVFFTKEMALVAPESPSEQARRVFQIFDPEVNGFIPDTLLEDVMKSLDLVSDPDYVNLMKSKLDPEGLGIVLLGQFLLEFFPDQDSVIPDSFPVYHYNGLKQSNHNEKVSYVEGTALIMGFEDPMVRTDDTPVKRCLQTKWPYIELLWTTERSPSLN